MSANNFLKIRAVELVEQNKDGFKEHFVVEDCDMETWGGFEVGQSATLLGAIKIANDYMVENIVEYGLHIDIDD